MGHRPGPRSAQAPRGGPDGRGPTGEWREPAPQVHCRSGAFAGPLAWLTIRWLPGWMPEQLLLASVLTAYCLLAPRLKGRRFAACYGNRFARYRAAVPYAVLRTGPSRIGTGRRDMRGEA